MGDSAPSPMPSQCLSLSVPLMCRIEGKVHMLPLLLLPCLDSTSDCEEKALHREKGGANSCFQNVSSQFAAECESTQGCGRE